MFLRDGYERVRQDVVDCLASKGYRMCFNVGLDYRKVMVATNSVSDAVSVINETRNTALAKSNLTRFLLNISRYYIELVDYTYEMDFFSVSNSFFNKMIMCFQTSMRKVESIGDPVSFDYKATVDDVFSEMMLTVHNCSVAINSLQVVEPSEHVVEIIEEIPMDVEVTMTDSLGLVEKSSSVMFMAVMQGGVASVTITDAVVNVYHDIDSAPYLRLNSDRIIAKVQYPRRDRFYAFELHRYLGVLVDVGVQRYWEHRRRYSVFIAVKGAGKSTSVLRLRDRGVALYEDEEIMKIFPYDGVIASDVNKWRETISAKFVPLFLKTLIAGKPMIWSLSNYEYFVRRYPVLRNFSPVIINVSTVYRHVGQSHHEFDVKRRRDREDALRLALSGVPMVNYGTLWSALDPDDKRMGNEWRDNT